MTTQNYNIKATVQGKKNVDDLQRALQNNQRALMSLGTAASVAGVALAAIGTVKFIKSLVKVGQEMESLKLRFKFLFGSVQEGGKAFQTLTDYAGTVPFSLEQIAAASGNLAIVSDDAEELNEVLKLTGNIAAVAGLDFKTTGEQLQRAFSTGAAAADIFRERGVLALLGFQQGQKITLDETVRRFKEVFGEGGEFGMAAQEFAGTLEGTLSMLGDKFLKFQLVVNESFFEAMKSELGDLNKFFDDNQEGLDAFATEVGEALAGAVVNSGKAVIFLKDNVGLLKVAFAALVAVGMAGAIVKIAGAFRVLAPALALTGKLAKKHPLIMIAFVSAMVGLVVFRKEIEALTETLFGSAEAMEESTNKFGKYQSAVILAAEGEVKARKDKIKAIKEEIAAEDAFAKAHGKAMTELERLGEDDLAGIIRQEEKRKEVVQKAIDSGVKSRIEAVELIQKIEEDAARQRGVIYNRELAQIKRIQEERLQAVREGNFQNIDMTNATEEEKKQLVVAGGKSILESMGTFNKKAFEAYKAVQIAEAIMGAQASIVGAFAFGSKFGGPLLGAVFAAAAAAKVYAHVNAIRSQQYPGREKGGTVMGNRPYTIGEAGPETFVPGRTGTIVPNGAGSGGGQIVNVNFNITAADTKDFDRLIRSRQGVFIGMINQALNEQGRRALV